MRFEHQGQLASYAENKLSNQIRRAEAMTRSLGAEERRRPGPGGGWSIDQILAHLARMNQTYVEQLEPIAVTLSPGDRHSAADELAADDETVRRWTPTLGGRLLRWTVTTSLRLKTPSIFRPGALVHEKDPFDAFVESQRKLIALLERMRQLDWSTLRCASPATALIRLNPGDVFLVLAEHGDRHMKQLERQTRAVGGAPPSG